MGGAYVTFHNAPFTSRFGTVLGRSMPGVIPGDSILRGPETVRYRIGFVFCVIANGNFHIVAGITGLSTRVKPSRIQTCPLQIQSLPYDREPQASDGNPTTLTNRHLQTQKNLELWLMATLARRVEFQRMNGECHRTTWFERVAETYRRHILAVEWTSCLVKCHPNSNTHLFHPSFPCLY